MSLLTAESSGSPIAGLTTSMDTLSGKLRHGVAQAGGVSMFLSAISTVAEVCHTGRGERVNIQQTVTAVESWPCEDLLTQRSLQDRQTGADTGKAKMRKKTYVKLGTERR